LPANWPANRYNVFMDSSLITTKWNGLCGEQDRDSLENIGFRFGQKGTHTSRTIMLDELSELLSSCPKDATREVYAAAIVEHNCLGKRTVSNRKLSRQRLNELYGLDPVIPLFRVMRHLWYAGGNGRALLALLVAIARDPLLRATVPTILRMRPGEELARQQLTDALSQAVGDRLSDRTLDKVVRNVASSWTKSGHLKGGGRKVRRHVLASPTAMTFALFLGYVTGVRGEALFRTLWAKVLDASASQLINLTNEAKRLGLLDVSQAGGIIEISFSRLLAPQKRQLIHGTD